MSALSCQLDVFLSRSRRLVLEWVWYFTELDQAHVEGTGTETQASIDRLEAHGCAAPKLTADG